MSLQDLMKEFELEPMNFEYLKECIKLQDKYKLYFVGTFREKFDLYTPKYFAEQLSKGNLPIGILNEMIGETIKCT